jgi:hypothetical protein
MTRFWRGAGGANFNKKVGSEFPVRELSGRRRRACALASVRRPNCTCGLPACSFHEDTPR